MFVPWGKHIPRTKGISYFVATEEQECKVCRRLIGYMYEFGQNYPELCGGEQPEYMPMCMSQAKVLQACPEFVNNWCYQDIGGGQVLKSPCPDPMICHYCLGYVFRIPSCPTPACGVPCPPPPAPPRSTVLLFHTHRT
jgi:hypothetical protein